MERWYVVVADFYRFYGIPPDKIMDMGFSDFVMLLAGLGEGSRWVAEHMAEDRKNKQTPIKGHKVAETAEELRGQFKLVGAQLSAFR